MKLYNLKLEVRALKTLCTSSNHRERRRLMAQLTPDHFYDGDTKAAFERIGYLVSNGDDIPHWNELLDDPGIPEDARERLSSYSKIKRAETTDRVRRIHHLLDKYRQSRVLLFSSKNVMESLEGESVNIETLLEATADTLMQARTGHTAQDDMVVMGTKSTSKKLLKKLLSNKRPNLTPTGFSAFDDKNGGFLPGSLVTLAATTGGGKTAFGIQMAINMSKAGAKVCMVPLEMSKEECMGRVIANISEISVSKYLYTTLTENEKKRSISRWRKFEAELKKLGGYFRLFEPEEDLSIEDLLTILRPYKHDVILVDYISLLRDVGGEDSWRQLGNVARFAKIWARNNNCIVILMAQLSEEGSIRYSRAIKEHSTNMFSWVYGEDSKESGIIDVIQQKARNQDAFDFQLGVDFSIMKLYDLDGEQTEAIRQSRRSNVGAERYQKFKNQSKRSNEFSDVERYLDDVSE